MPRKKEPAKPKVNTSNVQGLHAEIIEQPITNTLEINFMPYAMSVIVSRAIPEIDGFKPSHRKLLYTMYKMGLLTGGRTKSANIVGQTMRLNPHGDAAIYDTMVRLSRGIRRAAASLCGLQGQLRQGPTPGIWPTPPPVTPRPSWTPSAHELFRDIDSDTVDFVDNYDATMKEPQSAAHYLPQRAGLRQHRHCGQHGQQHLRL